MKTVSLSGSPRENVGKKDAKSLRAQGHVPCVVYGGKEQTHFSVDLIDLSKYVYTPDVFKFELDIKGKKTEAILKDLQFDPLTDRIIHADFLEIVEGKPVKMEIPVHIVGNSIGVRNGGRLLVPFRRLMVHGLPQDFPDAIEMDITKLRIGDALRISDINLPNVTFLHSEDEVIIAVKTARGAVEGDEEDEEETEEGAEEGAEEQPAEEAQE